jgi:hypothetical protein
MRTGWQYLTGILILLLLVILSMLFYFIPKAASLILPFKWDHIPLAQTRTIVWQYLGRPASSSFPDDKWKAERDNGEYILNIHYKTDPDTVAESYTLDFIYKPGFFSKTYRLKSESIK